MSKGKVRPCPYPASQTMPAALEIDASGTTFYNQGFGLRGPISRTTV